MAKKKEVTAQAEEKAFQIFTFRLPSFLDEPWERRVKQIEAEAKKNMPAGMRPKVSRQEHLLGLLKENLIENGCISSEELDRLEEEASAAA